MEGNDMDQIAFILGERFVYWNSIILAMAAAVAIMIFLAVYIGRTGNAVAGFLTVPVAFVASLVLARLVHWYCRADSYESLYSALTDYSAGGYALMGVFAGCFLTACVLRVLRICRSLPKLLDAMVLGGGAGIAVGRLACFYNTADRGMILEGFTQLPLVYPTVNAVTGDIEYRLATFVLQSIATGAIVAVLMVFYFIVSVRKRTPDGDTTLLFLLLYGASQAVLDSTRYDSLFMRSNGFISIVQILGALAIVLAAVVFSVRMVRRRGWSFWYLLLWVTALAGLGGAGYMEYYVQRHGDEAQLAYAVMSGCLALVVVLILLIRGLSLNSCRPKGKHA